MKKLLFIFTIIGLFFIQSNLFAQSGADSLIITPKKIYPVTQAGVELKPFEVQQILNSNPESRKELAAAKENQTFALLLGGAGGFMIGWPLGTAMGGGEPNWLLAGIGAGLVALSIPLSSAAKKKTLKAIELYNEGLVHKKETEALSFRFQGTSNGFGLVMKF